jgi:sugar lactone lactonase YvrE
MFHRHARFFLTAALAAAVVAIGSASTPIFWQVASRADFLKGDVDNLAIDNDGRLALGPATSLVYDSAAPFLWSLLPGADGVVYAGSGNEGKVFRIDRDGRATVFFDAPELEIHALAQAPDGQLYVAASPDGRIYRVDAKGKGTPFFAPEDKYIWSLAVDSAGNVYAGTGEKGVIYKIGPDGKGAAFYKTRSTNVVALAFDRAGNLLAGTESPGRVFRIDREGRGFVLLESSFREIHSLRVDEKGNIYATAVSGQKGGADEQADLTPPEPAKSVPVPSVSTEITSISIIDMGAATGAESKPSTPRIGARPSKGAVFRITPDGTWDTLWESPDDTPYDVAFDKEGGILIGTGNKGKLFQVVGDPPRVTLLGRAAAQQVTQFLPLPKGETLYATANPGKVFRLSAGRADRGSYESEVKDAETVATWGTISWRATVPAGAQVELRTRSGNSQTPDDTWSPWSEPYRNADGQQIQSPKARYLQWRASLTAKDASPVLTSVTAAYLQRNLRPKVTGITVYPAGVVFQKPFSTGEAEIAGFEEGWPDTRPSPSALTTGATSALSPLSGPPLGRRIYQKGLQAFSWKADDENDDKMQYDVLYRREDETSWRTLRKGISDQLFVWDTTSVPNGTYVIRIVASDAPSNPPGTALGGEADSTAFDVDNTPPTIRILGARREGNRTLLSFEVQDDQSAVQRVDYSLDANRWRPVYPKDGICDSKREQFELLFEGAPSTVVIRAMDAMSNVATARGTGDEPRQPPAK